MNQVGCSARIGRSLAGIGLAIGLLGSAPILMGSHPAGAQGVEADGESKAYWQNRFRNLRMNEAQLVQTVKLATKEYADSNRRTHRRSGVRHFHRTNANDGKAELEVVRAEIETIYDEGRAAGIPLFWLDEVAEEPIDMDRVEGLGVYADDGEFGGKGAYVGDAEPSEEEPSEDEPDPSSTDDGRNPLHSGSDSDAEQRGEKPASLGDREDDRFDYDSWRRDRREYEKRAPDKHLVPDEIGLDEEG